MTLNPIQSRTKQGNSHLCHAVMFLVIFAGKVYLAYKRNTNYRRFALKVIRTTNASAECVNEGKILTKLSHPNIIKIEDTFVSDQFYVIVMELASGGELFKYVRTQLLSASGLVEIANWTTKNVD